MRELEAGGATLWATEQRIDTSKAAGKAFLDTLGVFAECDTLHLPRAADGGYRRAKARGVCKGRKPSADPAEVRRLKGEGLRSSAIAGRLGIGRTTVWRAPRSKEAGSEALPPSSGD